MVKMVNSRIPKIAKTRAPREERTSTEKMEGRMRTVDVKRKLSVEG